LRTLADVQYAPLYATQALVTFGCDQPRETRSPAIIVLSTESLEKRAESPGRFAGFV
jgi:hypothetical protein